MVKNDSSSILIPGAIIISGLIIAVAIFGRGGSGDVGQVAGSRGNDSFGNNLSGAAAGINVVDASEHIRGNPNAAVSIIEFSDYECPFCARLHPTLSQIVREYPEDVKWVYRHFPLTQIHGRAVGAAVASECVSDLAGNDAFWSFTDGLFKNQNNLGDDLYTQLIGDLGIDPGAFETCLVDSKVQDEVALDYEDATNSGGRGTPYSIVISPSGNKFPFSGALPYTQVKQIVEQAINDI